MVARLRRSPALGRQQRDPAARDLLAAIEELEAVRALTPACAGSDPGPRWFWWFRVAVGSFPLQAGADAMRWRQAACGAVGA